jgi:hypothetical protein
VGRSCELSPPPNDPIFIIVVALLAIVMSIPIISLILYVLTKYASKRPGHLLPFTDKDKEKNNQNGVSDEALDFGVIGYQPSVEYQPSITNQSVFGSAITRGATGEQAEAFVSSTEMAHFAYAGTIQCNSL